MKTTSLSLATAAMAMGSAFAADLPSRKAEPILPPPPAQTWTGFYLGLNAGGTWANNNPVSIGVGPAAADPNWAFGLNQLDHLGAFSAAASARGLSGENGGFIGGGQIGYNWQFQTNLVAGVELDIQGLAGGGNGGLSSAIAPVFSDGSAWRAFHTARTSLDYLGTVRGRLGWLVTPSLLVFGTGGLAYGGVTLNAATTVMDNFVFGPPIGGAFGSVNFSDTRVGWTAGGGMEWMFWPNWSAKVEYLYYDLGDLRQNFAMTSVDTFNLAPALFGGQARARFDGHIVRAGLNYHFNWGAMAPVLSKN